MEVDPQIGMNLGTISDWESIFKADIIERLNRIPYFDVSNYRMLLRTISPPPFGDNISFVDLARDKPEIYFILLEFVSDVYSNQFLIIISSEHDYCRKLLSFREKL